MVVQHRNNRLWLKTNALLRLAMVRGLVGLGPAKVVLTEHPKSGGTWISQMVSESLDLLYPRHRLPYRRRCLLQGHYLSISPKHDKVVVWRDGRDIMVSFYYHILFQMRDSAPWQAERIIKALNLKDLTDITANLPSFIQYCLEGRGPSFSWPQFGAYWAGRTDAVHTSYEQMTAAPTQELGRVANALAGQSVPAERVAATVSTYSFENVANRQQGVEDPNRFVRKGQPGDWRNKFDRRARELFDAYAGDTLIRLGYEKDRGWIADPWRQAETGSPEASA